MTSGKREAARGVMLAAATIVLMALSLVVAQSAPANAPDQGEAKISKSGKVKRCGSVVKKLSWSGFYKAKVLVTKGSVPCGEARKIIWRSIKGGGFHGRLNGWDCEAKGHSDVYAEKCQKDSPRRVIKSSKPKQCRGCHANRKRPLIQELAKKKQARWKRCGKVHWQQRDFLLVEASRLRCGEARRVGRDWVHATGTRGCERADLCVVGPGRAYRCVSKPASRAIICTNTKKGKKQKSRVRLRLKGRGKNA